MTNIAKCRRLTADRGDTLESCRGLSPVSSVRTCAGTHTRLAGCTVTFHLHSALYHAASLDGSEMHAASSSHRVCPMSPVSLHLCKVHFSMFRMA
jgi:hypothetical protein